MHKINHGWSPDRTDPDWAERVEREAEMHTAKAERMYRAAERRLARALGKAHAVEAKAETKPSLKAHAERMWAEVEARRDELKALERLLKFTPAGSQHRGRGSHRGVPNGSSW
jgi:hypothetical protein